MLVAGASRGAGRGIALAKKNGELLWVCDLAREYGFTDTDGRYIPRFDPKSPLQGFPC